MNTFEYKSVSRKIYCPFHTFKMLFRLIDFRPLELFFRRKIVKLLILSLIYSQNENRSLFYGLLFFASTLRYLGPPCLIIQKAFWSLRTLKNTPKWTNNVSDGAVLIFEIINYTYRFCYYLLYKTC
jgi:hypothetical protein